MSVPHEHLFERPLSGDIVTQLPGGLIPARTALEGRDVVLEPIDPARHATGLFQAGHGGEAETRIWDYLPYGPFSDEAGMAGFLKTCAATFDTIFYAIRLKASDRLSGMCSYLEIKPVPGTIEIGHIWFAPHLQRTRAATEALFLLLDHAMTELRYRRMQWKCNALNQKSRDAANRLGFRFEGIHHSVLIVKGKNRDTAYYSILGDEWPDVRERMVRWLDAENFDETGKAKQSLSKVMAGRPASERTV